QRDQFFFNRHALTLLGLTPFGKSPADLGSYEKRGYSLKKHCHQERILLPMKHSTSLTPHATLSVHEHLEELLHTGLQAVLKTNLAEPRAGAGRPRELPSLSLWLAVVVGILRGVRSFRAIWRLSVVGGLQS